MKKLLYLILIVFLSINCKTLYSSYTKNVRTTYTTKTTVAEVSYNEETREYTWKCIFYEKYTKKVYGVNFSLEILKDFEKFRKMIETGEYEIKIQVVVDYSFNDIRVYPIIMYNKFGNNKKEIKKIAIEEGVQA
jgi:hypothetical protein